MDWFSRDWWGYLLFGVDYPRKKRRPAWLTFFCRLRGHPRGVVWQNCAGLEPDMTCKDCGDDLG